MEWSTILTSIVSACIPLIGVLVSNSRTQGVVADRVERLRADVEKHNQIIERTYKLEADRDNLFHRYEELKEVQDETVVMARRADEKAVAAHTRLDKICMSS